MKESRVKRLLRLGVLTTVCAVGACAAGPRSGNAEDRAITERVHALLEQSTSLQTPNTVTVQTVQRVVYLRGLVSTPYQRALAESLATQAAGEGLIVVNLIGLDNNR